MDEHRAACLLGFTTADLCRLSRLAGLGRVERDSSGEHMVFTYEELRKICLMAVNSTD